MKLCRAKQPRTQLGLVGVGARHRDVVQHSVSVQAEALRDGHDALRAEGVLQGAGGNQGLGGEWDARLTALSVVARVFEVRYSRPRHRSAQEQYDTR